MTTTTETSAALEHLHATLRRMRDERLGDLTRRACAGDLEAAKELARQLRASYQAAEARR